MALQLTSLQRIRERLNDAIDAGVDRAAEYVVDLAKQFCPVDTGALRASIRKEDARRGVRKVLADGEGGIDYARYVEEGTDVSPAQPFLRPAADAIDVRREVEAELRKLI